MTSRPSWRGLELVGNIDGSSGAPTFLPHASARKRCYRAAEEPVKAKTGPWGGIRLRGVGPAQPAAALRQRMWRSRTALDRALDPDALSGQVGGEVSGAGWRGRYSWLHPFRRGDTQ